MRLFGSRTPPAPDPPPEPEPTEEESVGGDRRFDKQIEVYPSTVKLLWHFFHRPMLARKREPQRSIRVRSRNRWPTGYGSSSGFA